jgi:hypothetical protein
VGLSGLAVGAPLAGVARAPGLDADQVPSDIPVIGFLFGNTQKTVEKQNIILALTPYMIHDPADLTRVLEANIRDRREFIRLYGTREERLRIGPAGDSAGARHAGADQPGGAGAGWGQGFNPPENPLKRHPRYPVEHCDKAGEGHDRGRACAHRGGPGPDRPGHH